MEIIVELETVVGAIFLLWIIWFAQQHSAPVEEKKEEPVDTMSDYEWNNMTPEEREDYFNFD